MHMAGWSVDLVHSTIQFSVRHLVIARIHGRFQKWSAELALDDANLQRSSVAVEIEAASVDTGNAQRDEQLRSPTFLDAATWPRLTFRSRRIEAAGGDRYRIIGDLTIRNVTKEVLLEAELGGFVVDLRGMRKAGFSAKTSLLRSEFGMVWNQVLETGGVAVADRVEIGIELEAMAQIQPQAQAEARGRSVA
jgi:polyisoprenoid-binding protein YceI